jgi:hypothetical protein
MKHRGTRDRAPQMTASHFPNQRKNGATLRTKLKRSLMLELSERGGVETSAPEMETKNGGEMYEYVQSKCKIISIWRWIMRERNEKNWTPRLSPGEPLVDNEYWENSRVYRVLKEALELSI